MKEVIRENVAVVTFIRQPNALMHYSSCIRGWLND